MANDDFYLIEQPLRSAARKEPPLQELEEREDSYVAISDMCRLGLVHPQSHKPMKKKDMVVDERARNRNGVECHMPV